MQNFRHSATPDPKVIQVTYTRKFSVFEVVDANTRPSFPPKPEAAAGPTVAAAAPEAKKEKPKAEKAKKEAAPAAAATKEAMAPEASAEQRAEIEAHVLRVLRGNIEDTVDLAAAQGWSHDEVVSVVKSLHVLRYLVSSVKDEKVINLTPAGKKLVDENEPSPEFKLLSELRQAPNMTKTVDRGGPSTMCVQRKWAVEAEGPKEGGKAAITLSVTEAGKSAGDSTMLFLKHVASARPKGTMKDIQGPASTFPAELRDAELLKDMFLKRKLVKEEVRKSFVVVPGDSFSEQRGARPVADLTREMLEADPTSDKSWQKVNFKEHNYEAMGRTVKGGYLHPLLRVRAEFRKILIGMGFDEMPTNRWVESSFWNFDSLFQPQQHPARDAHDTFFISPGEAAQSKLTEVPEEYVKRVQEVHEKGGYGSHGYRYDWSLDEAKKNVLRTHTTAVSSRMLHALANQPGGFRPKKYFSIDRVFRNETIDKTHLAEFHQVEGLVADYNLTLGDLKGTIETFFKEIGITNLRFKSAFNPYTEPSMEIFGFHPQLNKWTEIGNSGMFRPEMLRPMGLPEGVRVVAWGLSLERPTMIMTGQDHIRNLFGSGVSFDLIRTFPLVRFKKPREEEEEAKATESA